MTLARQTRLLVSVRSTTEATAALQGGADLIDIKEPSRGAMGRADQTTIYDVLRSINYRVPVSVALGELNEMSLNDLDAFSHRGLRFVKLGLANCRATPWQSTLDFLRTRMKGGSTLVPTAYADADSANSPHLREIASYARQTHFSHFLIDTYQKDGRTLLDHCDITTLNKLINELQFDSGIDVALAGSLQHEQILGLLPLQPAWIAVRGAVCEDGNRATTVVMEKVRALRDLIGSST